MHVFFFLSLSHLRLTSSMLPKITNICKVKYMYMFVISTGKIIYAVRYTRIYMLKEFYNRTLDSMPVSSKGPNIMKLTSLINWLIFNIKFKTFWIKVTVTSQTF